MKHIRKRLFAWGLKQFDPVLDRVYGPLKKHLLRGLEGTLLEIGPGTGTNFRYYPKGMKVIAIEPNPHLHPYLIKTAAEFGLELDLRGTYGEELDLPDSSVDAAVGTLVLCSVFRPDKVVSEIRRVLKPGAPYVFIEHVAACDDVRLRWTQQHVRPVWKWLFDGCRPDRETPTALEQAGFSHLEMDRFRMPIAIVGPHISGRATK